MRNSDAQELQAAAQSMPRGQVLKTSVGRQSGALVGFGCTLLATAGALATIPDDTSTEGALAMPASILAAGLLMVPLLRVIFFSARAWLRPENFVAAGIVYWLLLDLIQGAYPIVGVSRDTMFEAIGMVGVFAMAMWLGLLARPWRLPNFIISTSQKQLDAGMVRKMIILCFVLGMAPFVVAVDFDVVEMFSYLGQPRWTAPWARGQLGGWGAFLDHLQYFGFVLPSLAVFLAARKGWLRIEVWIVLGLAAIVLLFISQGGGRRIVGVTVGAAIISWVLTRPNLKLRGLVSVTVAAAALLWFMQFMLEVRSQGFEEFTRSGRQYHYLHVDDNIYRLAQVIEIVPLSHPFIYLSQIVFVLVRPIPRVLWEGKPIDPGFDLPSILGQEGTSLSMSIIGEWYLVFGWMTVILGGWLHGRFAAAVGRLIESGPARQIQENPVVYSISVMVLVAGLRSMQDLVIMSYAILAWFFVAWLFQRRVTRRVSTD